MTNNDDEQLKRILLAKTKGQLATDYITERNRHIESHKELMEKYSSVFNEVKMLRSENTRLALSKHSLEGEFQQVQQKLQALQKQVHSTVTAPKKHAGGRPLKAAPGSLLAQDVLTLRREGLSIRKIAAQLQIAPMTVQSVLKTNK